MPITELLVSLKVPDNVAISAFHALHRMGYHGVKNLERSDYYKFEFSGDKKSFQKKVSNIDILVNANKHKISFGLGNNKESDKIQILVKNLDNNNSLLKTLKENLGLKNIKKVEKGILWTLHFGKIVGTQETAEKITKGLLMNEHYQNYKILGAK